VRLRFFLTYGVCRGEWVATRPDRFTPRGRSSDAVWTGWWGYPKAGLDAGLTSALPLLKLNSYSARYLVTLSLTADWFE